ncbi:intermembrane lipid transfer protein VPS13C isoform X2 [Corythoichthys intestinalis]|uniref:intermembrane lipid transfer protein VPS13C isoform X2 n=1 Tax=Corythoichthys intestinalis TaxID=161448 RepID=UPI0025A64618|nr:intermembrane lipid transfer protein VPS13C isoform X2 [Corythoichthys intestinalis]
MVFESLVSDLLNRFVGDYVENLDSSQLRIGIWGGNVVLENLQVKENALSQLDIPVKVKAGLIGTLTLKIPWKNLYKEAVVATLDGLYLLLVPAAAAEYDEAKEERYRQEAKRRDLMRVEQALQTAAGPALKGSNKRKKRKKALRKPKGDGNSDKAQEEKKDSLMEKLATQVIKNLQVKISGIHLRYEDDVSDPRRPLSLGVTLAELSLQTADENWKLCVLDEAAKIIYKLGRLERLCAYWNVEGPVFRRGSRRDVVDRLKSGIGGVDRELPLYDYVFKPIFASAKIRIDPDAEKKPDSPKARLDLEVQNVDFQITKAQYVSVVETLESAERVARNAPYRKFRPRVPVRDNASVWWRYAISGILEVHVRRAGRMWSWSNIRQHRRDVKVYKTAYKSKILNRNKSSPDAERRLQDLENVLDVFNITLARQQAQMEAVRPGQKPAAEKADKRGGFFAGLFGRKPKKEEEREKREEDGEEAEGSALDAVLTAEEKEKLYAAIGYSAGDGVSAAPKEYVALALAFRLRGASLTVREGPGVPEILRVQVIGLGSALCHRPGARALRAEVSLQRWNVTGLEQNGRVPSLISSAEDSDRDPDASLLRAVFELNPDDSPADHVVRIHSQPVQIIYDAMTVNSLAEFFETGQEVDLEALTSATLSKLEEIKEKTAAGLAHVIQTRKVLDLKVDLRPSYLLLPKSGFYSENSEVVVIDFGNLQFNSADENLRSPSSSFSSLEEIMERAYERYRAELTRVQVLYSQSGDEWKSSRRLNSSRQHVLRPLDLKLRLSKCVVDNDARMPRFKVSGELPLVHVKVSDEKIQKVLELVRGIPLPRGRSAPKAPGDKAPTRAEYGAPALAIGPAPLGTAETGKIGFPVPGRSPADAPSHSADPSDSDSDDEPRRSAPEELTDLRFDFEVKEVLLELTRRGDGEGTAALALGVCQLGARGQMRTFDTGVTAYLRKITLDYYRVPGGDPLRLISCSEERNADLLKVDYVRADADGPGFRTLFDGTEQKLEVAFSSLDFHLDAKALLSAAEFLFGAVPPHLRSGRDPDGEKRADEGRDGTAPKGVGDPDVIRWKLSAALGCFHAELCDDRRSVADIRVQGLEASALVRAERTEVSARLRDVAVLDVDPRCVHKKVVSIMGEEVFSLELSLFPGSTLGDNYGDMSKVDGKVTLRLGCIKMVYLHKFLTSLLMFVDNFHPAKEAVSAATAQAAEKAASEVRRLARKSFRLSTDIRLKAPLVVVPRSSASRDAILVDLGLITVSNGFSVVPSRGFSLPAVVEEMDVRLTQLKLSRATSCASYIEILEPVNVELAVTRNMASSWFTEIPGTRMRGVLPSLKLSVGEQDLLVLMKILQENIGEGSKERRDGEDGKRAEDEAESEERRAAAAATSAAESEERRAAATSSAESEERRAAAASSSPSRRGSGGAAEAVANGADNTVNVSMNFEISEVLLTLKKKADGEVESPFLEFHLAHLGMDTKVRKYDTCATMYINKMMLSYLEFKDPGGEPLRLVSSSSGDELLKVQYFKADRFGPNFSSVYKNTEQMINVNFASLDLVLHTQALLSAVRFFSGVLASGGGATSAEKPIGSEARDGKAAADGSAGPAVGEIIGLKAMVALGAFNVLVCDQRSNIVDIKIQGLHGSLLAQGPQTHISARLKDFAVLDADPASLHQKAVSIVGDEVFSFSVSLTPNATEGAGYADTSESDGRLKLNVGCVRVVYLHKLVTALLNFTDNFQTAKAAVSAATAQAAERAASSVRDFAQKCFRLSTEVKLKAPLVVVPRSSTSYDALVADLGLITVSNAFSLLPVDGRPLPAVVDNMDVRLTQLKVSRTCLDPTGCGPSSELLEPVNLNLRINRNLSASWYDKMAAVELDGDLKPMKVALSREDLKVLLKILTENLAEAGGPAPAGEPEPATALQLPVTAGPQTGGAGKRVVPDKDEDESPESVKFNFTIESLGLVLYQDEPTKSFEQRKHRLGEFALHLLKASGKIFNNGGAEFNAVLTDCTLDDQRTGVDRVTSRMVSRRDDSGGGAAVDVTYRQSAGERSVVAVLQKLYVCASVEFLTAVADFFLRALPPRPLPKSDRPRHAAEQRKRPEAAPPFRTAVRAVVVDPEVVFVASLMDAAAPSLVLSFQCDVSGETEGDGSRTLKAQLMALHVLACPFIRQREDKAVTTVLRPCSVAAEIKSGPGRAPVGSVAVEEVLVKISPFILNTIGTITAAMTAGRRSDDESEDRPGEDLKDLWATENIYDCDYWFLGVERASEVTENFRDREDLDVGQRFDVQVKVIQVTLESGPGHRTVPLLLAESSFGGSAENWSSLLRLKANLTLEVNYFNEVHAVWEPLIERVDGGARRWNLDLEVKTNPVADKSPAHGDEFVILPEPRTAIRVYSDDTLNVTLSRCALDVLGNLARAFSEGAASTFDPSAKEKAPVAVFNALGVPLLVRHSANLRPVGAAQQGKLQELPPLSCMELEHSVFEASSRGKLSALQRQESCFFHLTIVPSGYSEMADVPVDKPGRRLYNIRGPNLQESLSVVVQIDAADGNKLVTVRSPLQIQNHFSVPFTVLKFCPSSRDLRPVGVACPEKEFHIPLDAYRCQLYLRPASAALSSRYAPSSTCLSWKEEVHRSSEVLSLLSCPPLDGVLPLTISVLAAPDDLKHIAGGEDDWDPAYVLHLRPVAALRNLLPYTLRYTMENCADSYELAEGAAADLLNARASGETLSLELLGYQGRDWCGHLRLDRAAAGDFPAVCLTCDSDRALTLELSVHAAAAPGRLLLSLFSPFWIINKTRRVLRYRADDVQVKHPSDYRDIVLFSFRRKNILSKNKIQMCVSNSSWSDGFSLDAVGSYGCVRCPGNNTTDFLVGVSIRMSGFNLTKMVTVTPFYTLVNKSSYELEVGELVGAATRWHYISSTECLPLWPESNSGKLRVRAVGAERGSEWFVFDRQDNGTLLRLDTCGGITVDVNVSDHSAVVGFGDYYEGAAPALLVNHTARAEIVYRQSGCSADHRLEPGQARRFAWDDPAGVRTLSWSCGERSGETRLLKDEWGQFWRDGGLSQVYWVSFLDGRQRVLIFTEDAGVVTKARQAEELEQFREELRLSLRNLGLSLVDHVGRREVAYVGVASSGVVWEMKRKNRWKALSQKHINLLEEAYQSVRSGRSPGGRTKVDDDLEVDLGGAAGGGAVTMRRPFACPLRRNFLSGVQVELKRSLHQRSLRAQLHWLQVDNQLPGAVFPIAFHPVPPPKSVAMDAEPKAFLDMSVITRSNQHSNVTQFKYFMVLVQEMAVKMDRGFLSAILALLAPADPPPAGGQKSELLQKDMEILQAELMQSSLDDSSGLNFFEHFHISPVKLHLSLSLGPGSADDAGAESLNLLLKSIGATLTDVDDLVFKLAYFEVEYQFYRREKLAQAATRHYSEQFLKQMYVLVLGLDVLGNPFGLIRGLSQGVEAFFYEPFQGAVRGPEEFAEGVVIGVRSLLGHTVGGAAGVVSRITGSVGKGLAAITMDKEYQQQRREEMNRAPKDFGQSLAKGGKGLLKGVVSGVTGIVTKPVEGARKEGTAGFFKGIGKGLVGVVARPTGGIVDMASSTFQGIQRAAESTEDVVKLRPVRLIREDGIIRAYDLAESRGFDLFQRSELKRLDGEVFRDQCPYPGRRKSNVMVTNRRVVCIKELDFVGHFTKEWECLYENFYAPPDVAGTRLNIYCEEPHKLKLGKKEERSRCIELRDEKTALRMLSSITTARAAHLQRRMSRQKSRRFLKAAGQP